jgi:hypothetical protein
MILTLLLPLSQLLRCWPLIEQHLVAIDVELVLGICNILPGVDGEFRVVFFRRLGLAVCATASLSLFSHFSGCGESWRGRVGDDIAVQLFLDTPLSAKFMANRSCSTSEPGPQHCTACAWVNILY